MKNTNKDLSTPHAQALLECVDKALREAGKLAKKRAEETGTPLVVRGRYGDEAGECAGQKRD